jgi:PST family polysaccharide transporter
LPPHQLNVSDRSAEMLQARSLASVFWLTLQNLLAAILLVTIPAVLAHLLTPEDLGLLEIALAFFGLATLFMELGTGPAIIQRPAVDETFLSTVFGVNVATGLIFAFVLIVGAPAITGWLRMDLRLIGILRWLGVTLVPLSTAIVSRNLLARRLLYRRVTLADAVAGGAATVAALFGLSRGLDVALTLGFLVYGTVVTTVLWTGIRWWPTARPDFGMVWPLLRFSLSVSAAKMLDNLSLQSDRFLIGRYLGAASLGLYGLARTLIRVPLRYFLNVTDELLLPGLAVLQGDGDRARDYYLTTLRLELAILGPAVIVAGVFATDFSRLLFGPSWDRAAVVAMLLAFAAWRHVTGHTTGAVLLSHGRPDLQVRWTTYALILSVVYFAVGRPWGLEGVAAAQAILEIGGWAIRHTMANRILNLSWRQFARSLSPLWIAHATFVLVVIALRQGLLVFVPLIAVRLAIGLMLSTAAYLIILRVAMPGLLTTLKRGVLETFAHGVARAAPEPHAVQASDATAG